MFWYTYAFLNAYLHMLLNLGKTCIKERALIMRYFIHGFTMLKTYVKMRFKNSSLCTLTDRRFVIVDY